MSITMPAKAPATAHAVAARLALLGQGIRAQRKGLGVSATALAQAAGMSRLTIYRIEHGEASVTMGAYLNALDALGMALAVVDRPAPADVPKDGPADVPKDGPADGTHGAPAAALQPGPAVAGNAALPARIRLADHAQLRQLAWQLPGVVDLSPAEALALYERNWRHVDQQALQPDERRLIDQLVQTLGRGRLLV